MAWGLYALGDGWGHLMRSLSLARLAAKHHPVHLLCSSPYWPRILAHPNWQIEHQDLDLQVHWLDPHTPAPQVRQQVQAKFSSLGCETWVVDTFPRGLLGELEPLLVGGSGLTRIWIHRDLVPRYVESFQLAAFVNTHYQGVLIPGEPQAPLADLGVVTAPWRIRSADELPDRDRIRWQLGVMDPAQPLIVVVAAGKSTELEFYHQLAAQLSKDLPQAAVRCLTPLPECDEHVWHWPGIDCLWAADVVVGGGGYNTVSECGALGVPLVAFAWDRLYDRQKQRLASHRIRTVTTPAEALVAVNQMLSDPVTSRPRPDYLNGAIQAIERIRGWEKGGVDPVKVETNL